MNRQFVHVDVNNSTKPSILRNYSQQTDTEVEIGHNTTYCFIHREGERERERGYCVEGTQSLFTGFNCTFRIPQTEQSRVSLPSPLLQSKFLMLTRPTCQCVLVLYPLQVTTFVNDHYRCANTFVDFNNHIRLFNILYYILSYHYLEH